MGLLFNADGTKNKNVGESRYDDAVYLMSKALSEYLYGKREIIILYDADGGMIEPPPSPYVSLFDIAYKNFGSMPSSETASTEL